jgi:hypothetical protein
MLLCVILWLVKYESGYVAVMIRAKVGRKRHMQPSTDGPTWEEIVQALQARSVGEQARLYRQESRVMAYHGQLLRRHVLLLKITIAQLAFVFEVRLELAVQALGVAAHLESIRGCFVVNIDLGDAIGSGGFDHELDLARAFHEGVQVCSLVHSAANSLCKSDRGTRRTCAHTHQ